MEKINSAGKSIIIIIFFPKEVRDPTFSEVPNTKNVDETDEETQHSSVTSLMLMLMENVRYRSDLASEI